MATGIIAMGNVSNAIYTYTALSNAKVSIITFYNSGATDIKINNTTFYEYAGNSTTTPMCLPENCMFLYVGAGQTINVTCANAATIMISALEE